MTTSVEAPPSRPLARAARSLVALLGVVALGAAGDAAATRRDDPWAVPRERAAHWLLRCVPALPMATPPSPEEIAALSLAIAALERAPVEGGATALAEWRARLRSLQRSDGSFAEGAGATSATWWALAAFERVSAQDDVACVARARAFLEKRGARPAVSVAAPARATTPAERALGFLGKSAARESAAAEATAGSEAADLYALAGGPFDVRAAYRFARGDADAPGRGLARHLALPPLASELHERLLTARVLARYRSARLVDLEGRSVAWPPWIGRELRAGWDEAAGGFRGDGGAAPTVLATACGLLALDAIAPWSAAASGEDDAALAEPRDYAHLRTDCEECHQQLQPKLHEQWEKSPHARAGVRCADCHGDNHSRMFREKGRVGPETCGKCHGREAAGFARSRHAHAEETLVGSELFAATPTEARAACFACHAIGARAPDGGASGSCNHCHTGHAFSAEQARAPEACVLCHTGADYPQDEAWRLSKHGALWTTARDPASGPTCATCHHASGVHDDGFGLAHRGDRDGRAEMVKVCTECHSSRMAEESLAQGDRLRVEGERQLAEAVELLRALAAEGLLEADASIAPRFEPGFEERLHDPALRADPLLERFYGMWRFTWPASWKGAYHQSPSVANHGSRAGLADELARMRADAAARRKGKEPR